VQNKGQMCIKFLFSIDFALSCTHFAAEINVRYKVFLEILVYYAQS